MRILNAVALACLFCLALPGASRGLELSSFPEARSILLGKAPVRVRPSREYIATAQIAGKIALTLPFDTRAIETGQVFAQLDIERIELEQRLLALAERRLYEKELTEWQLANQRNIEQIKQEIARIQSENALLKRLQEDPEVSAVFLEDDLETLPGKTTSAETVLAMLAENAQQLELLSSFQALIQSEPFEELEREFQITKLEQQRLNLEQRMEVARMDAPFAGDFRYLIPEPGGEQMEIRVGNGQEIARIRDMSQLLAEMAVSSEVWRGYPQGQLRLQMGYGFGVVEADYQSANVRQLGGKEQLVYTFEVNPAYQTQARSLIGGVVNGELHLDLDRGAHLVPKLPLLMATADAHRSGGWRGAVQAAFPGHELLAIGESALAVSTKPVK